MRLCNKHPKYKAIRRPRADCPTCWKAYVEIQKDRLRKAAQDAGAGDPGDGRDVALSGEARATERKG